MKPLLERLKNGEILVADGAMGTMLMAMGVRFAGCPESINFDRTDVLEEIARQYREVGAEIVQTNTFGGSPMKLAAHGLDGRCEEINRNAVQSVRRAVGDGAYVSASCGPCGAILQPYGEADPEAVARSFERQLRALAEAGADLFCVETMTDIREAVIAVRAAKSAAPAIPVIATMTFNATPRGFRTMMGTTVEECARELASAGADVVGSNCGNGIERMTAIAEEFHKSTPLPLLIQSNAGLPVEREGKLVYPETPAMFGAKVEALVAAGARIIGGCCGTTPDHVRAIRAAVNNRRS